MVSELFASIQIYSSSTALTLTLWFTRGWKSQGEVAPGTAQSCRGRWGMVVCSWGCACLGGRGREAGTENGPGPSGLDTTSG